jgi:uncharacterized phage protein gp47/JayE
VAFQIPDIKAVVLRTRNAFRAEMPGTDAWLWPNNVYVSAKVMGGAVWEVFGRLKWMDRQRFAMTADGYELERHGLDYGIGRKGASFTTGEIVASGNAYPLLINIGTVFTRSDGLTFTSTKAVSINKITLDVKVPVVCSVAGKIGNTVYGAPFTTNLSNIASAAADELGLGQGSDAETDDQLRARILFRKRYPPHGGAEYDYIGWGLSLPGVTRVFASGGAYGRGTVGVWFLMDDTYPAGIPSPADVQAFQLYLDAQAPITANAIVLAPIADCIDIVVKGMKPDNQLIRESVGAELVSMFRNMTQPSTKKNEPFLLSQSWIWEAVSNATGERSHVLAAPATDLSFPLGVMPCLKSVTFIP